MGINIDSMMDAVGRKGAYARNYLFEVYVNGPYGTPLEDVTDIPFYATSATIPAHTVEEITTDYQGFQYKQGGYASFETIELTFYNNISHFPRVPFVKWSHLAARGETGKVSLPVNYFGMIELKQLKGGMNENFNPYSLEGLKNLANRYTDNVTIGVGPLNVNLSEKVKGFLGVDSGPDGSDWGVKYELHNAWPSAVGEVTLDYTSKEITTFTVTITFEYIKAWYQK